jgi:plastocyanin
MTPETDPESPVQLGNWSKAALGKKKNNNTESSPSDSDGSEDADLRSQRRRFKASSLQYNGKAPAKAPGKPVVGASTGNGASSAEKELPPSVRLKLGAQSRADMAVNKAEGEKQSTSAAAVKAVQSASTAASAPSAALPNAKHSTTVASSSASQVSPHRAAVVTIEDYAFSEAALEVVAGQAVHFRLAKSVPAHAEHEIVGVSAVKALCFEAPLMQVWIFN